MGTNKKLKGNMYEFIGATVNPLGGECQHKCKYCYVTALKNRMPQVMAKYSGEPVINNNHIRKHWSKGENVFVCDCNDLFAEYVSDELIATILMNQWNDNFNPFYQTKNPQKMLKFVKEYDFFRKNSTLITTIETNRVFPEMGNTPTPQDRAKYFGMIEWERKQLTIEPIMSFDLFAFLDLVATSKVTQVNIGANSSKTVKVPEPTKEETIALVEQLETFTKVEIKSNSRRILGEFYDNYTSVNA